MRILHGSLRRGNKGRPNPNVQAFLPPQLLFGMVQKERVTVVDQKVSYLQSASDYGTSESTLILNFGHNNRYETR